MTGARREKGKKGRELRLETCRRLEGAREEKGQALIAGTVPEGFQGLLQISHIKK